MTKILLPLFTILFSFAAKSQTVLNDIINQYTKVEAINDCTAELTVSNPSAFEEGMKVLLIQMQGATIDQSNSSSFGNVTDYGHAGKLEKNEILSISDQTISLKFAISNDYTISGQVQLVSIPLYDNAIVNDTVKAQAWDGQTGGILIFEVTNELIVNGIISAGLCGFRGGSASPASSNNCQWFLNENDYHYDANNWRGAAKGEGIASFIAGKEAGRGAQANGGGGGNDHNAGAGGGANFTAGGIGGDNNEPSTFGCDGNNPGIGGKVLTLADNKFILGGGGGAGHGNNGQASDGGNGGGIIIIKTNTITSNGGIISANGSTAFVGINDGGGGGGAGGTIWLNVENLLGTLNCQANGGNGGQADNGNGNRCFGPGGGGSGGRFISNLLGNISLNIDISGGTAGQSINSTGNCNNSSNGAQAGVPGLQENLSNLTESVDEIELPLITEQPISITSCEENIVFNVTASGNNINYQWQENTGTGFENLTDDLVYSGSNTAQLSISTQQYMTGYQYQCVISHECFATIISQTVLLTINPIVSSGFNFTITDNEVAFINMATNATSYLWDFGDGTTDTGSNINHTYSESGTYTVTLIVNNSCGADTSTQVITIAAQLAAAFSSNTTTGCRPLPVQFTNESIGENLSFNWAFDGGQPANSTAESPLVQYNTAGTYPVSLTITNSTGTGMQQINDFITVLERPMAAFENISENGTNVQFENLSLYADTYSWDFGDGSPLINTENPTHNYNEYGSYTVTLNAFNSYCGSSITKVIGLLTDIEGVHILNEVSVIPNPTQSEAIVNFPTTIPYCEYAIIDMNGKILEQKTAKNKKRLVLNLINYPQGVYCLNIKTDQVIQSFKLVKIQ